MNGSRDNYLENRRHREYKREKEHRIKLFESTRDGLKNNISQEIEKFTKIDIEKVLAHEARKQEFIYDYEDLPELVELLDGDMASLSENRKTISAYLEARRKCSQLPANCIALAKEFGNELSDLVLALEFTKYVADKETIKNVFEIIPWVTKGNLANLRNYVLDAKNAHGIFGYLFSGRKIKEFRKIHEHEYGYKPNGKSAKELVRSTASICLKARDVFKESLIYSSNPS